MKLYSRQNNITHFVTSKFDGTPCEGKLSCTVWCGGKSGDDVKGLPIAIMRNKRAEGYVRTCIMIFIFCIGISVLTTLLLAFNTVRITKRNTYKVIDSYVTEKSIEAYNSIKTSSNTFEGLDKEEFKDCFCEYNNLENNGSVLISKTEDGKEKFRITSFYFNYLEDQTLNMRVRYIINIPIGFGDFRVITAKVPVIIQTKLKDKFY